MITRLRIPLIATLVFIFTMSAWALPKTKQEQMVAFQSLMAELKTHYGLIKYKEKVLGVTYEKLETKYSRLIENAETLEEDAGLEPRVQRDVLPPEEFRQLMVGLAAEFKDGHTNIKRNTDLGETLGIEAAAFGDKLIITGFNKEFYVDSGVTSPLKVGDEIVEVNGRPVAELAAENFLYAPRATYGTAKDWSLESILNVSNAFLRAKTEGQAVTLKIKRGEGNDVRNIEGHFHWLTGRLDEEGFFHKPHLAPGEKTPEDAWVYGHKGMTDSYFYEGLKKMGPPQGAIMDVGQLVNSEIRDEVQKLKDDKKDVPSDLQEVTRLKAYMVPYQGKNIGVIRIPNYSPDTLDTAKAEVRWLTKVIPYFESHTDGVILDVVSNNGGYVFYVSEVVRLFANRELRGVTNDMKLTETLIKSFEDGLSRQAQVDRKIGFGDPDLPNFAQTELSKLDMRVLKNLYESGQEWSGPQPYMGTTIDLTPGEPGRIFAGDQMAYTKPVLILNDMRSGSGGDFMPALMQANDRAKVFGATSMGLGAAVYRENPSMPGSEEYIRCPFGLCLRSDHKPIENVGVVPDVIRIPTVNDLVNGFGSYAQDALNAMVGFINGDSVQQVQAKVDEGKNLPPLKVSLPEDLMKLDQILPTLIGKEEVVARLKVMMELPQFKNDPDMVKRLKDLVTQIDAAGDDQRFAPRCDLVLGLM